jgi:hypothetical protein
MFDIAELREKGAKRAVLEYIASEDSSIPIPEPLGRDKFGAGSLLRSDHWREFDDFYGIFESVFVGEEFREPDFGSSAVVTNPQQGIDFMFFRETGVEELDKYSRRQRKIFEAYCEAKGLSPEQVLSEFQVFPQKASQSKLNGTIFLHPNVKGRHFLYVDTNKDLNCVAFVVDKQGDKTNLVRSEHIGGRVPLEIMLDRFSPVDENAIREVVDLYDRVSSLPKFQDGYVYMMEFGLEPTFVYQIRRFRKIEDGSGLECSWKGEDGVLKTDSSFGITPQPEGIVLPHFIGGMVFGPQILEPDWNGELHDFNGKHPDGFALTSPDFDWYTKTFVPNADAAFAGEFCHYVHHGNLANMAEVPLYLLSMKHLVADAGIKKGSLVRVFSNGMEAYVKEEKRASS